MPNNEPVVKIDKFNGLRNSDRPERLPRGSLVVADNVDIDDSRTLEIRTGYQKVRDFTNLTAGYATLDRQHLFVIDNGVLKELQADLNSIDLQSDLPNGDYYWTEMGDQIIFNGPASGIIKGRDVVDLVVPTPDLISLDIVSGSLPAGRYQVTSTRLRSDGAEGGAGAAWAVDVPDNGGLSIVAPPGRVYVTSCNGDIFYFAFESDGQPVEWDGSLLTMNEPLDPEQYQTFPIPDGCTVIAYHEARLFAAQSIPDQGNSVIWFSKEFWPHCFNLSEDFIYIEGEVRALASTHQGLFIGASTGLYVYTSDEGLQKLADYGVPPGYPSVIDPDTGQVVVLTERGYCSFPPFRNLTDAKVSFDPGQRSFIQILDERGYKKAVALSQGSGSAQNSAYE